MDKRTTWHLPVAVQTFVTNMEQACRVVVQTESAHQWRDEGCIWMLVSAFKDAPDISPARQCMNSLTLISLANSVAELNGQGYGVEVFAPDTSGTSEHDGWAQVCVYPPSPPPLEFSDLKLMHVGELPVQDGQDQYFQVWRKDGEQLNIEVAQDLVQQHFYIDTDIPGGRYMHRVYATPDPAYRHLSAEDVTRAIVVLQYRYNV